MGSIVHGMHLMMCLSTTFDLLHALNHHVRLILNYSLFTKLALTSKIFLE